MIVLESPRSHAPVHTLAFSGDGRTLASVGGRDREVVLWDLDAREVRRVLSGPTNRVVHVAFSPSDEQVGMVTSGGQLWLWALAPITPQAAFPRILGWEVPQHRPDGRLAFAPDGRTVATTLDGPTASGRYRYRDQHDVQLVALAGKDRRLKTRHTNDISCLAYGPDDGRWLATGSFDRTVRAHDLSGKESDLELTLGHKVHYLAFSPCGRALAAGSPRGLVKIWDLPTGHMRTTLKGQARPLRALCYSPDGRALATAGGEGTVRLWDVETGRSRVALDWGIGEVHAVAFAPDGMRAAAGGVGKVVLWDVDDWDL